VLLAALDTRVRAVVSNSYGGSVGTQDGNGTANDGEEQTAHGCHTIPGINRVLMEEDWVRLVAPRPALIVRGDGNSPKELRTFEDRVARAYHAHGASERFRVSVEPGGHEFYIDVTADFLAKWL
jgi:hypothetical protein